MIYAGCDNGLTGGLVALSDVAGADPISMLPMPVQGKKRGNEVDILKVWEWLEPFACSQNGLFVIVEKPNNGQTPSTAASMADSFGVMRALLALKGIRHTFTPPQAWQKVMLPGCEKGQTKPYALSVSRQLWPQETWLATPRCRTASTGLVDAALIAEFARRKGL